jgi:WD40 repeat protein
MSAYSCLEYLQAFDTPSDCTTLHATFSNDGKFVITADSSNKFRLWNIEGNKEVGVCSVLL